MKILAAMLLLLGRPLAAQMLPISGHILDSGVAVASGTISFTPTLCNGQATSFTLGGVGTSSSMAFSAPIVAGYFSTAVPDTSQTIPHICLAAKAVKTGNLAVLLKAGYSAMQPAPGAYWCPSVNGASACNFDAFQPLLTAATPAQSTPNGIMGPPGPPGAAGAVGSQGVQGLTGPAGPMGAMGPQGLQGVQGLIGPPGPGGPAGATGAASTVPGPAGATGAAGPIGATGAQGPQGVAGPVGATGLTGAQGPIGLAGAASTVPGPAGPAGVAGAVGAAGAVGPSGATGAQGPQGLAGPSGATGPQGASGAASTAPGPAGPQGPTGPAGVIGAQGPVGPTGPQGPAGSGGGASDGTVQATSGGTTLAAADTAVNQVISAGPNYGTVDTTHLFPTHAGSSFRFTLPGWEGVHYYNCASQNQTYLYAIQNLCAGDHVNFDAQLAGNQTLRHGSMNVTGASSNYSSNWRTTTLLDLSVVNAAQGIGNGLQLVYRANAAGDKNLLNINGFFDGGDKTQSDERIVGARILIEQNSTYYHGTSLSAGAAGAVTAPSLSDSTVGATQPFTDANHTTDGGILLDLSNPQISGIITGPAVPVPGSAYLMQFPTAATGGLPIATAYGACATNIPLNAAPQSYAPWTCALSIKSGAFVLGHHVWITGPRYPEEATVTTAGTVSGGTQTVTFSVRNPQPCSNTSPGPCAAGEPPVEIVQDSTVGYYFSPDYNMTYGAPRSTYFAFGSLDGTNLIVGFYLTGSPAPIPTCGSAPWCPGVTGKNGFHLIKGAEVIANTSIHHDPLLATNGVAFAVGDTIEAPPPVAFGMTALKLVCGQMTPTNGGGSQCHYISVGGPGASANYLPDELVNANDPTMYTQNGGPLTGMVAHHTGGYFDTGYNFDILPGLGLFRVSNMAYNRYQGGTGTLFQLPSDSILWDDTNRMFYSTGLASQYFRGPTVAPSGACPSTQSGWFAFSQDFKISYCNASTGAAGNWTAFAAGGGGGASFPAAPTTGNTTPVVCNHGGAPANCSAAEVAAGQATAQASMVTFGVGQAQYSGVCPGSPAGTPPSTGQVALVVNFNPTTCAFVPDTNGLAHLAMWDSSGTQTIVGAPPPPLTYAAIHAVFIASPNATAAGADCSNWLRTGSCTLAAGSSAQFAGSAIASNPSGSGNSGSFPITYTVKNAGALIVFPVVWQQSSANTITTPLTFTDSGGATCGVLGSTTQTAPIVYLQTVGYCTGVSAGSHTFTAASSGANSFYEVQVAEYTGAASSSPIEGYSGVNTGSTTGNCPGVTTTGTNELIVNTIWAYQATFSAGSAPGFSAVDSTTNIWDGLAASAATVAATVYTNSSSNGTFCSSFAIKHL